MAPIYELSSPYFYSHPSVREDFAKTAAGKMTDMEADGEAGLYMAVRGWQGVHWIVLSYLILLKAFIV